MFQTIQYILANKFAFQTTSQFYTLINMSAVVETDLEFIQISGVVLNNLFTQTKYYKYLCH